MKKWNKPQMIDLNAEMTEFTWQGKGADGIWKEAQNVPDPQNPPQDIFGES